MREIKFRLWCNNKKEWEKNNWAINQDGNAFDINRHMELNMENHLLMQYTGLKDKNGIEIYEGDIVKSGECVWDNTGKSAIMKVVYNECCFKCEILNADDLSGIAIPLYTQLQNRLYEVIGNIHQNKELLDE